MMTLDSRICAIRIRLVNRCRQTGFLLLSVFFGLATGVAAGQAKPNGRSVSAPTVTFTLDFPQSDPTHYSLSLIHI